MQTCTLSGCISSDVTEDSGSDSSLDDGGPAATGRRVERSFTCTVCGYGTTHEVGELETAVRATCLNCGDWTVQTADVEALLDAAREIAERLSGTILTERQAWPISFENSSAWAGRWLRRRWIRRRRTSIISIGGGAKKWQTFGGLPGNFRHSRPIETPTSRIHSIDRDEVGTSRTRS